MLTARQHVDRANRKWLFVGFVVIALVAMLLPFGVYAVETGLEFGSSTGLAGGDIRTVIARIIQVALGLLGMVTLVCVIYGGVVWTFAGGDAEKVTTGKKVLVNCAIGLVIILSAFSITTWVLSSFSDATTGPPPPDPKCKPGYCEICVDDVKVADPSCSAVSCEPDIDGNPTICSIKPAEGAPEGGIIHISGSQFGSATTYDEDANVILLVDADDYGFDPTTKEPLYQLKIASCSGSATWSDTRIVAEVVDIKGEPTAIDPGLYRVIVTNAQQDADGNTTSLWSGYQDPAHERLEVLEQPAVADPYLICATPSRGVEGDSVIVEGKNFGSSGCGVDDYGAGTCGENSGIITFAGDNGTQVPTESGQWTTTVAEGVLVPVGAISSSDSIGVTRHEATGDYTGPTALPFTVLCDADGACGTGCCTDSQCTTATLCASSPPILENQPTITDIIPRDGAGIDYQIYDPTTGWVIDSDLITIRGKNFGNNEGHVFMTVGTRIVEATPPEACGTIDMWHDDEIIVQVPDLGISETPIGESVLSSVKVQTNEGLEATRDGYPIFHTPDLQPGICSIIPDSGAPGSIIDEAGNPKAGVVGLHFGTNTSGERVLMMSGGLVMDNTEIVWTDTRITNMKVPELAVPSGRAKDVYVAATNSQDVVLGNVKSFTVTPAVRQTVVINSITPDSGGVEEYVRIAGKGFGAKPSGDAGEDAGAGVWFLGADDTRYAADMTSIPQACGDSWHDDWIIVKVPPQVALVSPAVEETYDIVVRTVAGEESLPSAATLFTVINDVPGPGVCSVSPISGPAGTALTIIGERFGVKAEGDDVIFSRENKQTSLVTTSWNPANNNKIAATVPTVVDGAYGTIVKKGSNLSSPWTFTVADCTLQDENYCTALSAGTTCCGNGSCDTVCTNTTTADAYSWRFKTGDVHPRVTVTTPSGNASNHLNAVVAAQFDYSMDMASLRTATTVDTWVCADEEASDTINCDGTWQRIEDFDYTQSSSMQPIDYHPYGGDDPLVAGFTFSDPDDESISSLTFEPLHKYQVVITDEATSDIGFSLEGLNYSTTGDINNAFRWEFATATQSPYCDSEDDFLPAQAGGCGGLSCLLNPESFTAPEGEGVYVGCEKRDADGNVIGAANVCCPEGTACIEGVEGGQPTYGCAPLFPPAGVSAEPTAGSRTGSVAVAWTNVTDPAFVDAIHLERRSGADSWTGLSNTLAPTTEEYTDVGLTRMTEYFYRLAVAHTDYEDTIHMSAYSDEADATTDECATDNQCAEGEKCFLQPKDPLDQNSPIVGRCGPAGGSGCLDSNDDDAGTGYDLSCRDTSGRVTSSPCCDANFGICSAITRDGGGAVTCSTPTVKTSNKVAFEVIPGKAQCAVCLTRIQPARETWKAAVTFFGKNFGGKKNADGTPNGSKDHYNDTVYFTADTHYVSGRDTVSPTAQRWWNRDATPSTNALDEIATFVPLYTESGLVRVYKKINGLACQSNPLPFTVVKPAALGVAGSDVCNLDVEFVEGESETNLRRIPSPSPQPDEENICVNAVISISFTKAIADALDSDMVEVCAKRSAADDDRQEDDTGKYPPCAEGDTVPVSVQLMANPDDTSGATKRLVITPADTAFTKALWYRVIIKSPEEGYGWPLYLADDEFGLGLARDYVWYFKTRNNEAYCDAETVLVTPSYARLYAPDETKKFTGQPATKSCQFLQFAGRPELDWSWRIADPTKADFEKDADGKQVEYHTSYPEMSTRNAIAKAETIGAPTTVNATFEQSADISVTGSGFLRILFDGMRITEKSPIEGCAAVCLNAATKITFDKQVESLTADDQPGDDAEKIYVAKVVDITNGNYGANQVASVAPSQNGRTLTIALSTGDYLPATQYEIGVRGGADGLHSSPGHQLVVPQGNKVVRNGATYYAWRFTTGQDECVVDRAEINPQDRQRLWAGWTDEDENYASYAADLFSAPDLCSARGQSVKPKAESAFLWRDIGSSFNTNLCANYTSWGPDGDIVNVTPLTSAYDDDDAAEARPLKRGNTNVCLAYKEKEPEVIFTDGVELEVSSCTTNLDCEAGGQCAGSVCEEGRCTPVITSMDPTNGAGGTWVTVNGCYFGNVKGEVEFGVNVVSGVVGTGAPARWPVDSNAICSTDWTDTTIITEVPFGQTVLDVSFDEGFGNPVDHSPLAQPIFASNSTGMYVEGNVGGEDKAVRLGSAIRAELIALSETMPNIGDGDFTLMFWMKAPVTSGTGTIVQKGTWDLALVDNGSAVVSLPFAEGSGTTTEEEVFGGNVALTDTSWDTTDVPFDNALIFDGTSSEATFTMGERLGTESFAIDFWIRTQSTQGTVMTTIPNGGTTDGWEIVLNEGKLQWRWSSAVAGNSFLSAETAQTVHDGAWHHVMYFVDRSAGVQRGAWVIDGALAHTTDDWSDGPDISPSRTVILGRSADRAYTAVALDELRLYVDSVPTEQMVALRSGSRSYIESNGLVRFNVLDDTGATVVPMRTNPSATSVADGAWHHVAYTKSGLRGSLYIDGKLHARDNWSAGLDLVNAANFLVAPASGSASSFTIDDLRMVIGEAMSLSRIHTAAGL